jgi:pantothenate kinase type III
MNYSAADAEARIAGGAIVAGLKLQLQALSEHTAQLPQASAIT